MSNRKQTNHHSHVYSLLTAIESYSKLEMWANSQRDGRPAEY